MGWPVCFRMLTERGLATGSGKEQTITSAAIIFGRKISTFSEAPHFTGKVHVCLAHLGLLFQPVSLKALSVLRLRAMCFEEEPRGDSVTAKCLFAFFLIVNSSSRNITMMQNIFKCLIIHPNSHSIINRYHLCSSS